MHGRLKVKTTEEQAEAKRIEREKKLRQYVTATKAIFEKRKLGQLDKEALELTSQILGANPDFATLWNFRREIFLHLQEETPEEMQALCKAELSFLESCLRVNPKSYGTWRHRCWVMEHIPEPDWARELELCSKFLESDERNFHCWDYRRFVVRQSQVAPQDELAFSDSLITRNFSNYSSWHYRSHLLPQLYPDAQQQGRITEEILLKELELVQNAFFTDPNDQSAWFYHRWLLGRADPEPTIRCVYVSREDTSLAVAFSHPVAVAPASHDLIVFGDESPLVVRWRTPDRRNRPGFMWLCDLPASALNDHWPQHTFRVLWAEGQSQKECVLFKGHRDCWSQDSVTEEQVFRCELSIEKSTVLQSELESCKELQALEPENKWCLLTIILLMRALDPLVYEHETLSYFTTLKAADPMRAAYLDDLRSKFLIENSILKMEYAEARVVDLSQRGLTILCHLEHLLLVTHMNISDNLLRCLPPTLAMMRCLEVLEADDNQIETLEGLPPLPRLEELSLCNNRIQQPSGLRTLATFPKLAHLNLQGNPLCQIPGVQSELAALLPNVGTILT
ncbi:geranylgeranyl transferase type-2 subunit alpha isoform X2 [Podarcis raffonei]|uniref:geranylgeranyl transferase type-2 subunit alpha isoform X2 n=1 Tax=Podarcis raffonei TaxID=65483 RepID=UPI0023292507|nr:geranylgeranyl transferase type-2 subunit alpha isoform X2 [Podarcis raffonei]XP_053218778.1 geranylgeranyl transferase type-2 subunit alpha isoform X2 [Podarcis raffonei]XP_053218779.1 geranylgeranyl transferase type-2 subunit alpha isoform X2 [Podarcis raffonei]XP_053218780.1 geranylgeranyl transferase type-2 subunit alpha isoform X2 [Podarcis raffonei]XP_053218781.1 geranylgeranyl transferase type-2 subunit alpha isoform X2 [Podarcis raffonei]